MEISPKNGRTGGCILLENGRGLKNQGGIVKILEKDGKFVVMETQESDPEVFSDNRNIEFHCFWPKLPL
ncbi:hypothetical protein EFP84_20480 [Leptospira kmetyi]|uniref:Uncharacterized protein n=1 Tax=Leptospira kmetyi TaxID=408139 RepID=A0A5F1XMP1_9LEPT|nr:hypothetical protein EFP84_20480 [Leptospira kmetyi]TGK14876.1 hypothetical protein EHO62_15755 [Leptospira kmetyi]TGK33511.1 hypothetical protein EHO66_03090 [Leptospira kmetyi]